MRVALPVEAPLVTKEPSRLLMVKAKSKFAVFLPVTEMLALKVMVEAALPSAPIRKATSVSE